MIMHRIVSSFLSKHEALSEMAKTYWANTCKYSKYTVALGASKGLLKKGDVVIDKSRG